MTLRIDVDYVPWDTPDATEFGHGEPAAILRLLEMAKQRSVPLHFFASSRSLRAFPSLVQLATSDDHALDWFCKHPEQFLTRWPVAEKLFEEYDKPVEGFSVKGEWPASIPNLGMPTPFKFLSATSGAAPDGLRFFQLMLRTDREAIRAGQSYRTWIESAKTLIREAATRRKSAVISVRPQVLARHDPKLGALTDVLEMATAVGMQIVTLRTRYQRETSSNPA